jgi:hypothetical protein
MRWLWIPVRDYPLLEYKGRFVKLFLNIKQFSLNQGCQNGHTVVAGTGFVQYPVDFLLVCI